MADKNLELAIRLRADVAKAIKDFDKVTKGIDKQGKAAKKANKQNELLARGFKRLGVAAAAFVSVQMAVSIIKRADAFATLQQRIKTATKATGDYNEVSKEIYEISRRNGSAMESTVSLFQNLARTAPELGATNQEMLQLTDTLQQLGRIGGSSAAAMSAGIMQFSQAMSAGVFRAEEFNSLVENTPEIVARIAKGLGKTQGQLGQMVLDGKLLSKDVFKTLQDQAEEIAKETADMPLNIALATQSLSTSFDHFLGQLNQATGLTSIISNHIQDWADALDSVSRTMQAQRDHSEQEEFNALQRERIDLTKQIADIEKNTNKQFQTSIAPTLKLYKDRLKEVKSLLKTLAKEGGHGEPKKDKPEKIDIPKPRDAAAEKAEAARQKRVDAIIKSLQEEADTYGMTAEQIELYRLKLDGASDAEIRTAQALIDATQKKKDFADEVERTEEAIKKEDEATKAYNESLEKAARAIKDALDPMAPLRRELDLLEVLMRKFPQDADLFQEAMLRIHEQMDEMLEGTKKVNTDMDEFAIQAARNMQSAFADFLFDPFDQGLEGMLQGFVSMIHRMVSEMLAQQLLKSFFTAMSGMGGGAGAFFGTMAASIKHTGGMASTGPTRQVSPLLFANAPRYHSGNAGELLGIKPGEVPAVLKDDEEVLTRNNPRHILNQGSAGQNQAQQPQRIILVDDRANIGDYMRSSEGESVQVEFVRRNSMTIRSILGV